MRVHIPILFYPGSSYIMSLEEDLKKLVSDVGTIKSKMGNIDTIASTVQKLDTKMDQITGQIEDIKKENEDLKSKVEHLSNQNKILTESVNDLQQYSRKDNLIINGIPTVENEDVREQVKLVAKALNIVLHDSDICTAHRLPSRKDRIPAIVVRLNNRDKKSNMIKSSRQKRLNGKDLNFVPAVPIYVSDHLTTHTAAILRKANDLKRKEKIASVWVIESNVYIREIENGPATRVKDMLELDFVEVGDSNEDREKAEGEPTQQSSDSGINLRSGSKPLTLSQLNINNHRSKNKRGKPRQQV